MKRAVGRKRVWIAVSKPCKDESFDYISAKNWGKEHMSYFPQVPTALKLDLILKNHQKIGWIPYKSLSNSLSFNATKDFSKLGTMAKNYCTFFATQNSVLKSKHLPPSCLLSTFEATNFLTFDNWDWLKIPAVTATSMHCRWNIIFVSFILVAQ